jgi:aconitase B
VAIREGQIALSLGNENIHASARPGTGEILEIDGLEVLSRSELSTLDDRWAWTQLSRPRFNLDDATFYEYLKWAARETGRTLIFESELVRQQTATNRKRGMVEAEQVEDVLKTDEIFRRVEGSVHELIIGFRPVR